MKIKGTTSKSKHAVIGFREIKKQALLQIVQIVEMEEISGELILNCDQTGLNRVPSSSWTVDKSGTK